MYYGRSASEILNSGEVKMNVTFDPNDSSKVNLMQFQLAQFSMNGTFLGFTPLTDQLILCPHSLQDSENYREFGTNVEISCQLNLTSFLSEPETIFYDLYFVDQDGTLLDVPVLILNVMLNDGSIPNTATASTSWQLVRRFFIYDIISGIQTTNGYQNGDLPTIIQYLRSATIRFTLRADVSERIYIPYLILNYRQRALAYIDKNSLDSISFTSEYSMDTSKFWTIAEGIFIGTNILVLFC